MMTMTVMSAKIEDMRSIPWPLAAIAMTAMVIIGTLAMFDKDVAVASNIILLLLVTLGIGQLQEIKNNTNGTNNRIMDSHDKLMDRALPPTPQEPEHQ